MEAMGIHDGIRATADIQALGFHQPPSIEYLAPFRTVGVSAALCVATRRRYGQKVASECEVNPQRFVQCGDLLAREHPEAPPDPLDGYRADLLGLRFRLAIEARTC